jgi:hypothetical protein
MLTRSLWSLSALAILAAAAGADFTITPPLMHSAGARGNAGNSVYMYTYSGPDAVVTGGTFIGSISSIIRGTTIGEAWWNIRNTRFGTTGSVSFQPVNLGYFENSVLVVGYPGGGMILKTGDVLRIETHEYSSASDDGAGTDAVWNDVHWTFETAVPTSLGTFEAVTDLRTNGDDGSFGTDTEIGLFNSDGVLLRWNDDYGDSANSRITGLSLADGVYYLCVMPYDSTGANGLVRPGNWSLGDYGVLVNGVELESGSLSAYSNAWYTFTVGTAPACPADFNGDGFLDFFDYDEFVAAFEVGGPGADFNGDGFQDFFDFDAFVEAFEIGC